MKRGKLAVAVMLTVIVLAAVAVGVTVFEQRITVMVTLSHGCTQLGTLKVIDDDNRTQTLVPSTQYSFTVANNILLIYTSPLDCLATDGKVSYGPIFNITTSQMVNVNLTHLIIWLQLNSGTYYLTMYGVLT